MSVFLIVLGVAVVWTAIGVAVTAFLGVMATRRPEVAPVAGSRLGDSPDTFTYGRSAIPPQRTSRDTTAV